LAKIDIESGLDFPISTGGLIYFAVKSCKLKYKYVDYCFLMTLVQVPKSLIRRKKIEENGQFLARLTGSPLRHFRLYLVIGYPVIVYPRDIHMIGTLITRALIASFSFLQSIKYGKRYCLRCSNETLKRLICYRYD